MIHHFGPRKYFEVDVTISSNSFLSKIKALIKKHEAIPGTLKEFSSGGLFRSSYAIYKIYVPIENLQDWTNEVWS